MNAVFSVFQVLQVMRTRPRAAHGPEDLWPVLTGTYETVLVWLRLQFSIVIPVAIAILSKEVRRRVGHAVSLSCSQLEHACCTEKTRIVFTFPRF